MMPATPWWHKDRHTDRRPILIARGRIKSAIRRWFENQGFIEIDTACLQVSPGNETHLNAFKTELHAPDGSVSPLYLHTSPEFACKKLLAAGEEKIFTFAPVFRNRERGPLHSPEFTMLEWYRTGMPYQSLMDDCIAIMKVAADAATAEMFKFRSRYADPRATAERLTVADACHAFAGIDLLATIVETGPDRDALADAVKAGGIRVASDDTWADIFSRIIVERIEMNLGNGRPTILAEYPTCESALARPTSHDPRLAERFELYVAGVELANCFGELNDANEQRRRLTTAMGVRARVYGERYPIDEDFLAALAQMPPASGGALGFDRLVMLATGAPHLDQVLWTPVADPAS
jgi:elongation factor P--(R)-beta-lysine ligase